EVIEVPIPAVLSVTTDISAPRLPTMKEILKAGKKPIREWSLADLGLAETSQRQVEEVSTLLPQQVKRKQVIIEGAPDEAARVLLEALSREGVL
ncbi:MAG: electron transfer flavoprotein, partial [Anaerolineae bacterium]|nr:electron transfer flavoprotein [Anaerolineae bacterium]